MQAAVSSSAELFLYPGSYVAKEFVSIFRPSKYVSVLRRRFEELRAVREDVQGMVRAARGRGEVITNVVQQWIRNADEIEVKMNILEEQILQEKTCCKLFPSFSWNFIVSKQAVGMIDAINDLHGKSNFAFISYPLPFGEVAPSGDSAREENIGALQHIYMNHQSNRNESLLPPDSIIVQIIDERLVMFSHQQIKDVTDNFRERLGEGGFGVVFKGRIADGPTVAVKILNGNISHNLIRQQFKAEVNSIGRTHHFNLVRLFGFCFDDELKALVYEFMENGSLDSFLFDDHRRHLIGWEEQLNIAIGTAKGIAYLHEDCRDKIIHYDIKPGNVLLDSRLRPKVADFGLAKLCSRDATHITKTGFRGTPGYAAPEMWLPYPVTHKCDAYSFGMLLFEILGKRKNYDTNALADQQWLPKWIWNKSEEGALGDALVGFGIGENSREQAERMAMVALWCVQQQPEMRPSMSNVVKMLEGQVRFNRPPNPFPHILSVNNSESHIAFTYGSSSSSSSTAWLTATSHRNA